MVEPRLWRMERLAPSRMGEKMTRDRSIGCLFLVITWVLRPLYSVPGKEFLISICKLLPIVYLGTYMYCRYTRMECRSVHQVAMKTWNYLSTTSLPVLAPAGRLCLPPPLPLTADPPQSLFPLALQDPVQLLLLHPTGSSLTANNQSEALTCTSLRSRSYHLPPNPSTKPQTKNRKRKEKEKTM